MISRNLAMQRMAARTVRDVYARPLGINYTCYRGTLYPPNTYSRWSWRLLGLLLRRERLYEARAHTLRQPL